MRLILRKNDSATSLLLFIYNLYMAKTAKDYIKLSSLLEMMKVFGKSETAIRMSLSRAAKAGLLTTSKQNNEVYYALTLEGNKTIMLWNEGVMQFWERYSLRNSEWDNKWYFINANFKEEKKDIRAKFLDKLQQFGFAQINTSAWITPYHQYEEVRKLIKEYSLEDGIVEIYGEMEIHEDVNSFLDKVFGTRKLENSYREFVNTFSGKLVEVRAVYKDHTFISSGTALQVLHELGWSFFESAALDAVLPRAILSEWAGDQAAYLMRELREMLIEASYKYIEKFE